MDHGVATYPQDGDQRDALIRFADERLYHFKQGHDRAATEQPQEKAPEPPSGAPPARAAEAAAAAAPPAAEPVPPPPEPAPPGPPPPPAVTAVAPPPEREQASPLQASRPAFPTVPDEQRVYAVPRKAERVSMSGTNAYAVLADLPIQRARVVDLGFGGVALDFPLYENLPETLLAVLHVPILPPVRVNLKRVWIKKLSEDTMRVGCCFIS
jgi:hypothetical protein